MEDRSVNTAPQIAPSLGEFIHLVRNILESVQGPRILWFRGQQDATWDLVPRIWRDYDDNDERNFTNRFRSRATSRRHVLPEYENWAIWLSIMQHYGLPTRLLDWTRSPLIAAYFALEEYIDKEPLKIKAARIWVLKPHILNKSEHFGDHTPSLEAIECKKMLAPAFTNAAVAEEAKSEARAAMAAEKDPRMFVQQGCFTIHSDGVRLNKREGHSRYLSCIEIPKECVREMAKDIDVCGFRKGDMFPDLEHLADELRAKYPPRRRTI
jgi:hypothetical protein